VDTDHQHFRRIRLKSNYVYSEEEGFLRESAYFRKHPERPLRYTLVARQLYGGEIKLLPVSVEVVKY
jgi:hypothetical protein